MWIGFAQISIENAIADDSDELAGLHSQGFARGWSSADFASFLSDTHSLCIVARRISPFGTRGIVGFALFRQLDAEAELLSVAVLPSRRRSGIGRCLLDEGLRRLYASATTHVFLEVAEDNEAARLLYDKLGFRQIAKREAYYPMPDGRRTAALVMRLDLR